MALYDAKIERFIKKAEQLERSIKRDTEERRRLTASADTRDDLYIRRTDHIDHFFQIVFSFNQFHKHSRSFNLIILHLFPEIKYF